MRPVLEWVLRGICTIFKQGGGRYNQEEGGIIPDLRIVTTSPRAGLGRPGNALLIATSGCV
jgi:hypothetical protein